MIASSGIYRWLDRTRIKAGSVIALAILSSCVLISPARAGNLHLCNDGSVDMSLIYSSTSLWLDISPYRVEAWFDVSSGDCFSLFIDSMTLASFAFALRVEKEMVPVEFSFRSRGAPSKAPRYVCVTPHKGGRVAIHAYGGLSTFQTCGANDIKFPFSLHVSGSQGNDSLRMAFGLNTSQRDTIAQYTQANQRAAAEKAAADAARAAEIAAELKRKQKSQAYVMNEVANLCGPPSKGLIGLSLPPLPFFPTSKETTELAQSERKKRSVQPKLEDLACENEKLSFWKSRYKAPKQGWRDKNFPSYLVCEGQGILAAVDPTRQQVIRLRRIFDEDCQLELNRGDGLIGKFRRYLDGTPESRFKECVTYKNSLDRCDQFLISTEQHFRDFFSITED